jgi:hypothetical protein
VQTIYCSAHFDQEFHLCSVNLQYRNKDWFLIALELSAFLGVIIENGVYRRWSYILADVLAMDNLHVGAAPRLFCGFFLK